MGSYHVFKNIWVVNSSDGGNGSAFAYYPADVEGSGSIYDGVVSSYWAVGRTETAVWTHYKIYPRGWTLGKP